MAAAAQWPPLGIVTTVYRPGALLDRFLADLTLARYPILHPVFVLNAASPDEERQIRAAQPGAEVLRPPGNVGTAAAWNLALERLHARGVPYAAIWNVDVRLAPDAPTHLIRCMESDPRVGASQPLLLYSDEPDTVEMFGGTIGLVRGSCHHDFKGWRALEQLPSVRDAEYLDGGSMLLRLAAWEQVGGFDERLFMYAEDSDLCLRLRRVGFRTVAVRDARAWHFHREVHGRFPSLHEQYYDTRNRLLLIRKHCGPPAHRRALARALARLPRRLARYVRRGRVMLAIAHLHGLWDGAAGRGGKRGWVE